jgi:hypothetical protein
VQWFSHTVPSRVQRKEESQGSLDWKANIWWLLQDTTVILLDVSQSMHKHLPETVSCIQSYLQQKVFICPSVQVNNFVGNCRRTSLIVSKAVATACRCCSWLSSCIPIHTTRICVRVEHHPNVYYSQLHPSLKCMISGTLLKDADVKVE